MSGKNFVVFSRVVGCGFDFFVAILTLCFILGGGGMLSFSSIVTSTSCSSAASPDCFSVFFFPNSVVPFLSEASAGDSADNYLLLDLVSLGLEIVTFLPSIFPFLLGVDFSLAGVAFSRSRDSDAVILHSSMVGSILGSISCFLAWAPPASSVDLTVFLLLAFFPWERFPFCFRFVLLILVCCSPFRLLEGICWFCGWFHAKWIGLRSSLGVGSNFFNSCSFSRSLLILFLWLRSCPFMKQFNNSTFSPLLLSIFFPSKGTVT